MTNQNDTYDDGPVWLPMLAGAAAALAGPYLLIQLILWIIHVFDLYPEGI